MTTWIRRCLSKLRMLFVERQADREFRDEIEDHIELLTDRFVRSGMSHSAAVSAARRQFGNAHLLRQRQRELRGFLWPSTLFQDVRYGLHMLAKHPALTAIVITSLALGIGANTAIFTLAKAALFDALSVPHTEQLRLLAYVQDDRSAIKNDLGDFYSDAQGRTVIASFSYPAYLEMRNRDHTLGNLFAFVDLNQFEHLSATINGHAEVISAELVSGNFFQEIGAGPILGRVITPADDARPGSGPVAVISDSFWQRRFGRSPAVIGQTIQVNLTPVLIIGVTPPGFSGASRVQTPQDLFLPISMQPLIFPRNSGSLLSDPDTWWLQVMGRLQPNVGEEQARASLAVSLNQAMRSTMTVSADQTVPPLLLLPGGRGWNYAEQELEHPMPILLVLAALVLLLACVNIANLLLARFSSREREIGVRLAIGATKARVVRQMLTESLCLAVLGGFAGLVVGFIGRGFLPRLLSSSWGPAIVSTRFDWRVFAFTLVISVLTGLAFGAGPAWQAAHTNMNAGLKDGGTSVTRRRKGLGGRMLVVVQVSLCMLLLVCAGLFASTLANLNRLNLGFDKTSLLLFAIEPPPGRYPAPRNIELLQRIEQRLASLPGLSSASLSREALLAQRWSNTDFILDDAPRSVRRRQLIALNSVGPSFFSAMRVPILYGRSFDVRDTSSSPAVAVINRSLAQERFSRRNPIGVFFRTEEGGEQIQIVGICADAKYGWLRNDPPPTVYLLYAQQKDLRGSMTFEVRTQGNPANYVGALRDTIESIDKDLPLIDVRTQEEQINATLAPERSFAALTSGFGMLALILASIGIYGIMAASVSRRVNEIGVRMALGARADQVLRMVLSEATLLVVSGIGLGLCAALFLTRLFRSLLFGLAPTDSTTLGGAGALLFAVAIFASLHPAFLASRIQPVQALRHE